MGRASRDPASPLRTRLFIPAADASTIRWIENQENVSVSLRTVIHEVIERHGYGDVFNRQVEQQPRRGRPPGGTDEQSGRPPADAIGPVRPVRLSQSSEAGAESSVHVSAAPEPKTVGGAIASPVASVTAPVRATVNPSMTIEKPATPASPARPAPAPADDGSRTNDAIMDLLA